MVLVTATQSFEHGGARRRGQQFELSQNQAQLLKRKGLVTFEEAESDPSRAAGETSSASPAAPVSPQTTAKKSASGAKKPRSTGA